MSTSCLKPKSGSFRIDRSFSTNTDLAIALLSADVSCAEHQARTIGPPLHKKSPTKGTTSKVAARFTARRTKAAASMSEFTPNCGETTIWLGCGGETNDAAVGRRLLERLTIVAV